MKIETLEVNGVSYQVRIHYENRNNTHASVGKKEINIRIPIFLNREEMFKQLLKMKWWVKNKLEENQEKFKQEIKEYKNNEILKVGNEEYILNIAFMPKQTSSAVIFDNKIRLSISNNISKEYQNKHISSLISRCIAQKRLPQLQERINNLNQIHFNQRVNKIFFKNIKSRWGSCSSLGNINISTRLLFAPDDVLEYVCIHELAHLIEHNHSDRFWSLVEKAVPNYKEKEKWLKENGHLCVF
ncbi:M48 family metallopeptidase [Candidatus Woesearchaeota archaeon]|nr:M48 family metallopeptidase [Candidatus Woesearchaeota archaeon]